MLELNSLMLSEYLKCPACNKEPNPERLARLITEGSSYNITHFDPKDPVIVSGSEIYCSTQCYAITVVKQDIEYE
ncbi:MAG TPA: hypothetical protein VFS97_02000 [Nitrososphaeraceae archaeon]|nr:hypothetical protein [Nitrososphaeraceae archaeon]